MTITKASDPADQQSETRVDAENSSKREDERLEHGIKESFPGSDPVSVKVSKYAPGDPRGNNQLAASPEVSPEEGVIPSIVERAQETAAALSELARSRADNLLDLSREYVPELKSRIHNTKTVAEAAIRQHPVGVAVTAILIACCVGVVAYELMANNRPRHSKTNKQRVRAASS